MRIEKDFKEFIELLNSNEVRYLVVGGFAVSYYSKPRYTKDIDILIECSEENSKKIIKTLNQFGFGEIGIKAEDFQKPDQIVQLGYEPVRIDIINTIVGIEFATAWLNKEEGKYGNIPCFFISKKDLIKNKQLSGRQQDKADVEILKKFG